MFRAAKKLYIVPAAAVLTPEGARKSRVQSRAVWRNGVGRTSAIMRTPCRFRAALFVSHREVVYCGRCDELDKGTR
jgi:hypothetical protein